MSEMAIGQRVHLQPLRGPDPRAEWRLLIERRRVLRTELADIEGIMDGLVLEMLSTEHKS